MEAFLAFEREWLLGEWTWQKVAWTLLVPLSLGAFVLAFWRRSLGLGLLLLNLIALAKIAWSVGYGGDGGRQVILPALVGMAIGNALVLLIKRRRDRAKAG